RCGATDRSWGQFLEIKSDGANGFDQRGFNCKPVAACRFPPGLFARARQACAGLCEYGASQRFKPCGETLSADGFGGKGDQKLPGSRRGAIGVKKRGGVP